MKVCYVTHLPNLTGASQSLLDMVSGIEKMNVEPTVLLGKHGPIEQELKNRKISYTVIPYSSEISEKNYVINVLKRIRNKFAVRKIEKYFIEQKYDLVHNNSFLVSVGMEAAYKAKIPYVCHNRDFVWEDHRIRLLTDKRQNFLLKNASAAIAISDAVYRKYSKLVPDAKYHILHDGIDINKYYQEHTDVLKSEIVELLFAGRIAPGKGQLEAIKAVEYLREKGYQNYRLSIVGGIGDEDYDKYIRDYVENHHLNNVRFLGFSDLRTLRSNSDITLVCSEAEALGRVTIESMLSGCLVIGAAAGATLDLISDGETGLLYELGNIEDLANKLIYAVNNPIEMNQIVRKGQTAAKDNFDTSIYKAKLVEIYKDVLTR